MQTEVNGLFSEWRCQAHQLSYAGCLCSVSILSLLIVFLCDTYLTYPDMARNM